MILNLACLLLGLLAKILRNLLDLILEASLQTSGVDWHVLLLYFYFDIRSKV